MNGKSIALIKFKNETKIPFNISASAIKDPLFNRNDISFKARFDGI